MIKSEWFKEKINDLKDIRKNDIFAESDYGDVIVVIDVKVGQRIFCDFTFDVTEKAKYTFTWKDLMNRSTPTFDTFYEFPKGEINY